MHGRGACYPRSSDWGMKSLWHPPSGNMDQGGVQSRGLAEKTQYRWPAEQWRFDDIGGGGGGDDDDDDVDNDDDDDDDNVDDVDNG